MTVGELRALLAPHNEHRQVMVAAEGEDFAPELMLIVDVGLDNSSGHGTVVAIQCERP